MKIEMTIHSISLALQPGTLSCVLSPALLLFAAVVGRLRATLEQHGNLQQHQHCQDVSARHSKRIKQGAEKDTQ
jgi:hypothetical protein